MKSIIHDYLYGQFKRNADSVDNTISIGQIHTILKFHIRIPKKYHGEILNEMGRRNLMKKKNRDTYVLSKEVPCVGLQDSIGRPLW